MQKGFVGLDGFIWWQGVVEDRNDPLMIGRVRVRVFGFHTDDKTLMPTENLPWAVVGMPIDHGNNPVGLREGDWVVGFFRDGIAQQEPVVMFVIPGIPTQKASPERGFSDPTTIDQLYANERPRPPEFGDDVNFAASMVTGIQDASKQSVNTFISSVQSKMSDAERVELSGLSSQLSKFDSKSMMNLAQSILQNPTNIQTVIAQIDNAGVINELGIQAHSRLSEINQNYLKSGLSTLSRFIAQNPDFQNSFQDILQTQVNQRLTSFVRNDIPQSVMEGLSSLGSANPINQITSNLMRGGSFHVSQLFDGNITANVNGIITSLLPKNPLDLISKLGRDTAKQIGEFLGLDFGPDDSDWVEIDFEDEKKQVNKFTNEDQLPIESPVFGVLSKEYDPNNFPYDMNRDGMYDGRDAEILKPASMKSASEAQDADVVTQPIYPHSRYPLEPFLQEPTTPRLARNEKIEDTILSKKKSGLKTFAAATYAPIEGLKLSKPTKKEEAKGTLDDMAASEGEPFEEPASPYNAKYPFNHVYASESGHFIEIDDTPKAERLHWYHRSGTFREMHPDGTLVDKSVKDSYDISTGDMFKGASKNVKITSGESTAIKAESELVVESGSTAVTTGELSIKSGTTLQDMEGGHGQRIADNKQVEVGGDYSIKTEGDFSIEAKGKVTIDAESISMKALQHIAIDALGSHISIRTLAGVIVLEGQTIGNNTSIFNVTGAANLLPTFFPLYTPNPEPPLPIVPEVEEKKEEKQTATFKPGFVLKFSDKSSDRYNEGYLYKPESDSDGKPVVLCPPGNGPIKLYYAIPTGELEDFEIEYLYAQGAQPTKWKVKRPKHRRSDQPFEIPRYAGNGNGGRDHYRFAKYAKDYPQQFIVADNVKEFIILDGKIRHD